MYVYISHKHTVAGSVLIVVTFYMQITTCFAFTLLFCVTYISMHTLLRYLQCGHQIYAVNIFMGFVHVLMVPIDEYYYLLCNTVGPLRLILFKDPVW